MCSLSGCCFITPHCWCLNVDDNIKCLCVYIEYPPTFASLPPPFFFGIDTPSLFLLQNVCGTRDFLFVITVSLNLPFPPSHTSFCFFKKELYLTSQVPLDGATETFMYEYCLFLHSAVLQCTAQLLFADLVVVLDMTVTTSVVVFFDKFSYVASADI